MNFIINQILIPIGNFFFRWRDTAFTLIFAAAFYLVTFPELAFGSYGFDLTFTAIGFAVALLGQFIRAITIGYAYIKRGGLNKKIYADRLVIEGMFNHSRNPLYVGNILIVFGAIMVIHIFWFYLIVMPLFYLIYISITLAEEQFLKGKFGADYELYMKTVNRFVPHRFSQWSKSIEGMDFTWKRLLKKEHNTTFIVFGALLVYSAMKLHFRYAMGWDAPQITGIWVALGALVLFQLVIVSLKKTGRLEWDPDRL